MKLLIRPLPTSLIMAVTLNFFLIACGSDKKSLSGTVNPDFRSHLPLVVVETGESLERGQKYPGQIKLYDRKSNHVLRDNPTTTHSIEIKIRGHSSSHFAKKQFGFELKDEAGEDLEASLLGMPKHEDWILHAPYSDKTLMRNHVAFTLWEKMGHYAVRRKYVELFFKEGNQPLDYRGVYLLWEKIGKGDDRLDVGKASEKREKDPLDVGGFIISKDKLDPEDLYFEGKDKKKNQFVYPKDKKILPEQIDNIKMYYDAFTDAVFSEDLETLERLADVDSFIDHALLKDFSSDTDAYWASTFFHRPKNGRLIAGPVWDFNIAFGNHRTHWASPENEVRHLFFWEKLLKTQSINDRYQARWRKLRHSVFADHELEDIVDETITGLGDAIERNFTRWDVLGEQLAFNPVVNPKYYSGEITIFKNWLWKRAAYFDRINDDK